jgi:putative ABC transport system substrate-binding protein
MIGRRELIALVGGAAAAWPLAARAQQGTLPVVALLSGSSREMAAERPAAFLKGLAETGFMDGQNVAVEFHWLGGVYEQVPTLLADLVRRRVAVIATSGVTDIALAAKAATTSIPIVFGVSDDPVKLGLVASIAKPGGNATGLNFFAFEVLAKRLSLLHELVPKAVRIALLINPADLSTNDSTVRALQNAAAGLGLQIQVLNAGTRGEIAAAFANLAPMGADALFIAPNAFYDARRVQLAILAARLGIPTSHANRDAVEAGLLMSYGTDVIDGYYRQVAIYAGRILKGANPADTPVTQATKIELVINAGTAAALGLEVPPSLLAIADEVIE